MDIQNLSQDATDRGHTLSNAVFLPLIPFCLLGFLNSLFIICGSQILKRTMNKASLVSFLGNTEKERTMGVDMTRVFCYSVLQLTFQVSAPNLFKKQKVIHKYVIPIQYTSDGAASGIHTLEKCQILPVTFYHGMFSWDSFIHFSFLISPR